MNIQGTDWQILPDVWEEVCVHVRNWYQSAAEIRYVYADDATKLLMTCSRVSPTREPSGELSQEEARVLLLQVIPPIILGI